MNTAAANRIISQIASAIDILFFSSFTAVIPLGEVNYHLTVGSDPLCTGLQLFIKIVDNIRVVLRNQKIVNDSPWVKNIIDIADGIANDVSPLISTINDRQHLIQHTSKTVISSKTKMIKLLPNFPITS